MDNFIDNLDDKSLTERQKIDDIIKKIETWYSYFSENNREGRELKMFLMGRQWEESEVQYYKTRNKYPLVINKLYAFVSQLLGEERQVSPSLKVVPLNYNVDDPEVSQATELIEDIVQSIEYNSKTNIVYQTTYRNQLEMGYGSILVYTDYRSENSFDQEIKLMGFEEPEYCYWDITAREQDKSDGEFTGYLSFMPINEFKKRYPDIDTADIQDIVFYGQRNLWFNWIDKHAVAIANHYQKIWKKKTISLLNDGSVIDNKDLDEELRKRKERLKILQQLEMLAQAEGRPINLTQGLEKIEIVDEREVSYCDIRHYRLIRNHILEENDIPCRYLPLVYVDGDSRYHESKQYTRPFIKFAQDVQKFINYCATETMSYIRGGRKEKFLATRVHVQGNEESWRGIDNDNLALFYEPDLKAGTPPIPIPPLEIPPTLLQQYQRAENDLYTVLGRYEPVVGARSREVSRVALNARIMQGNITAFTYPDNLRLAQYQIGKIILDLIPTIYDNYRILTIEKRGIGRKTIEINKKIDKDKIENKIEKRDYEIEIVAGSSFAAQKAEAYDQLMDLIAKIPAFGNIIPDLAAENLDLSNTPKIVERARKYMIPQIAMAERGQEIPPPPPNPQEELMRSMSEAEQKKADASLLSAQSKMLKAQSDVRKDFSDNEAKKIKATAEVGKANLDYQTESIRAENERLRQQNETFRSIVGALE